MWLRTRGAGQGLLVSRSFHVSRGLPIVGRRRPKWSLVRYAMIGMIFGRILLAVDLLSAARLGAIETRNRSGPGLEGHRREPARGSWDVAQWAGSGKTQVTRQDRASCGLRNPKG